MLLSKLHILLEKLQAHQLDPNSDADALASFVIREISNEIFMQETRMKIQLAKMGLLNLTTKQLCLEILGVDDDTFQRIEKEMQS